MNVNITTTPTFENKKIIKYLLSTSISLGNKIGFTVTSGESPKTSEETIIETRDSTIEKIILKLNTTTVVGIELENTKK
ncbi:MAG: hypothetical protein Q4C64_07280 [Erysipelotrichia bacterium]|nr:hypothetical protein [Erysipelotrichia bacterium]